MFRIIYTLTARVIKASSPLFAMAFIVGGAANAAAAPYESQTIRFQSADLVAEEFRKGPNHVIQDSVVNKGYMNHYRITSPFGEFTVVGDWRVTTAIHEIDAIAALKEMSKTELVVESAAVAIAKPVEAVQQLVEEPKATLKGFSAGVGRLLARATDTYEDVSDKTEAAAEQDASGDAAIEVGSQLAQSYFGVSGAHRELAQELQVDPYTRNAELQRELSSMAKYAAAGSFGTKLMMPSVPGAGLITGVQDLVWTLSPKDLQLRSESALVGMGVDGQVVERFFDNPHYTPSDQIRFVAGLEVMENTKGREGVVREAADAQSAVEALFYVRVVEMLAAYHRSRSAIHGFSKADRKFPLALTRSGSAVLAVAVDYLYWNKSVDEAVYAYVTMAADHGGKIELWVEGRISARARDEFAKVGWTVFDGAFTRLQ